MVMMTGCLQTSLEMRMSGCELEEMVQVGWMMVMAQKRMLELVRELQGYAELHAGP
jgi:hypothetical protein